MKWLLIAFVCLTNQAAGQVVPLHYTVQICRTNSCRIQQGQASAVNVGQFPDGSYLFVSAGHLFGHEIAPTGQVPRDNFGVQPLNCFVLIGNDNDRHDAKLLRYTFTHATDLSFWSVRCTADRHHPEPLDLAKSTAKPGERLEFIGYGDGQRMENSAECLGETEHRMTRVKTTFVPGDSGGAALSDGVLVGIISGYKLNERTVGLVTPSRRIIDNIRTFWPTLKYTLAAEPAPAPPPETDSAEPPTPPAAVPDVTEQPSQPRPPLSGSAAPLPPTLTAPSPKSQSVGASGVPEFLTSKVLPLALAGTTGGLSVWAIPLAWRALKRFRRRRLEGRDAAWPAADPLPKRSLDEARQLVRLGQLEGRDPLLDAARGMFIDDAINDQPEEVQPILTAFRDSLNRKAESIAPLEYSQRLATQITQHDHN